MATVGERAENWGLRIQGASLWVLFPVLLMLQILKTGVRVPYSEHIPSQVAKFPVPHDFHGGLSLILPGVARLLHIQGKPGYIAMSFAITVACLAAVAWLLDRASGKQRLPLLLFLLGPVTMVMLGGITYHDPLVMTGFALVTFGRGPASLVAGGLLAALAHPELAIVGLSCLLITTLSATFRPWLGRAALGLPLSVAVFAGLRYWAHVNGVTLSRFEVAARGEYPLAPLNFLSNCPLELLILLWPLGLPILLQLVVSGRPRDWLCVVPGAFALPLSLAIVALDQTRDSVLAACPSLFLGLLITRNALETAGVHKRIPEGTLLCCAAVLFYVAPLVQITYTGHPMSPHSQLVHEFFREMPVGW